MAPGDLDVDAASSRLHAPPTHWTPERHTKAQNGMLATPGPKES